MAKADHIHAYSVAAEDGGPGLIVDPDEVTAAILEAPVDPNDEMAIEDTKAVAAKTLGPPDDVCPNALGEARWGVIWPPEPLTAEEKVHRDAVMRLFDRRRNEMGGQPPHEFYYHSGWSKWDFLWADGREVRGGEMRPEIVPYYLCIVASPERVPWEFQQQLDGEYAVGRIWFDDPDDCGSYVDQLLDYEAEGAVPANAREVLFVGTQHEGDGATNASATILVKPLHDWFAGKPEGRFAASLLLGSSHGEGAYKNNLLKRLKGFGLDDRPRPSPAILFTAGHGLEYKNGVLNQRAGQGALIFQEWPGPLQTPGADTYLTGGELDAHLRVAGMTAFCFACFSAGTPREADWVKPGFFRLVPRLAERPFVAHLPQKFLARGMLAFIGHVSKAWDLSFLQPGSTESQVVTFRTALNLLSRGARVGHATNTLNTRWVHLTDQFETARKEKRLDRRELLDLWLARNDCRGYVVLGDPAVRLRVELLRR
jgi:hypothetical protein